MKYILALVGLRDGGTAGPGRPVGTRCQLNGRLTIPVADPGAGLTGWLGALVHHTLHAWKSGTVAV